MNQYKTPMKAKDVSAEPKHRKANNFSPPEGLAFARFSYVDDTKPNYVRLVFELPKLENECERFLCARFYSRDKSDLDRLSAELQEMIEDEPVPYDESGRLDGEALELKLNSQTFAVVVQKRFFDDSKFSKPLVEIKHLAMLPKHMGNFENN